MEWKKSVGDQVSEDEVIAVVETDKVSVDVRSTHVGVVVKLFAAVDDVVRLLWQNPACRAAGELCGVWFGRGHIDVRTQPNVGCFRAFNEVLLSFEQSMKG